MNSEDRRRLGLFVFEVFAPEIKDLPKLAGYLELSAFDKNRMKLNKIELFNLN